MALHRDIYWVGRQWAVTGFGMQAIDQRLKGNFDIEVAHLWDDDLPERMRALAWLNAEDFDKALDDRARPLSGAAAQELAAGRKRAGNDSAGRPERGIEASDFANRSKPAGSRPAQGCRCVD